MSYQLSLAWHHIKRSPYQAIAAVMVMTLMMFVGIAFLLLSLGMQQMLVYLEQKPQVIAFFDNTITSADQVQDLADKILVANPQVKVRFVSKEEALQIYQEKYKPDPLLLELVTANALPASLEVSAKNIADLPKVYEMLKEADNIESISYQKNIVDSLISVLDKIRKGGLIAISFLVTTTLLTIITIIGMKISLRKSEVEIEKLVGASSWFIYAPFLLEGFFYGFLGTLISWVLIYFLLWVSTPHLLPFLGGLTILPVSPLFMLMVLIGGVIVGGLVGIIGSFLAVWRYSRLRS